MSKNIETKKGNKKRFRKRLLTFGLIAITCFLVWASIDRAFAEQKSKSDIPTSVEVVIVEKGDTLWDIAETYCPDDTDIRVYIYKIMEFNDMLSAGDIKVGEMIGIPIYE